MEQYDPFTAPDPAVWLARDETERLSLVQDYHRRRRVRLSASQRRLHALLHVIVENQIAMGDPTPAQPTLERLMAEGLDRHDAIHAIGSVLAAYMFNVAQGKMQDSDPNISYVAELAALTAEKWRTGA